MDVMKICRNCGREKVNRPRGLCWSCYYRPGVRDRFESESIFGRRGRANGTAVLPPNPTQARPGSPEKIAVMIERLEAGFALHHPGDLKHGHDPSMPKPKQVDLNVRFRRKRCDYLTLTDSD